MASMEDELRAEIASVESELRTEFASVETGLRTDLPSGTTGAPMSYMHEGRQYIVVAVGSLGDDPELVALGLR